ncbi:T9SS type B sorting domain-containing protein [Polaribacter sp. OB-PA-B3]
MLKKTTLIIFFFAICFTLVENSYAQLSKKHFIPPLTSSEFGNANPENQYLYISTPSNSNVTYKIIPVGQPNSSVIEGVVTKNTPKNHLTGNGNSQLFVTSAATSQITNNKGYIIEADDAIYVSVRVLAGGGAQAGALVSKGNAALGKIFRAGMFTNENPQDNYLSFISVMATENETEVIFSDIPTGISIKNYTGSLPITVSLDEGESYIVAANSFENTINRDGLIGALIESDKPIVVNSGSTNGSFHNGGGRDYGFDQIVGIEKLIVPGKTGSEYIFVKGDGNDNWENVLIVAHEDNTEVRINGGGIFTTLDKGDYTLIEGNEYNTFGNMFVKTSKPAFAYQGVGANNSEANQGLFFVPPLNCENRGKVDNIPNIENIGGVNFTGGVTIVTNKNATLRINSQVLSNFNTTGPFNVDGNTDYVTYQVSDLTGNISIESSEELYCAYFNQNGAASSGSFYSGFPSNPEINFDVNISSLGNCLGNDLTLNAANTTVFDGGIEWQYFNELISDWTFKSNATSYKPLMSEPGKYRLIGKITCSNNEYISNEILVSICPDDYDNDGIIDNIDLDIDNDGILNCDESLGNANVNLSNLNTPNVVLEDGTVKNIISTSFLMQSDTSNSFTGTNNGDFTSTLVNDINAVNEFKLSFSQSINLRLKQTNSTTHQVKENEYFIIKIKPENKNITLLNPDNQLLVDTNNDNIYESGITEFSASEIKFKYNTSIAGTASTFKFLANQIDEIHFYHSATNTDASTFSGNYTITCFEKDSDNDGIEDMFDLDSDNDGIPDLFDAYGKEITLLNTDANSDGIDDIFNSITTNLDTDNDGIKNYLDVDVDNDGIFDGTEANHGKIINSNGILNTFIDTNKNGLDDSVEDSSALINYTILDTDADSIFNFAELDADNDACFDVLEAGFNDNDNNGILDTSTFDVNNNGKVINNSDGYTSPNLNYTTSAPIIINTPFEDFILCEETIGILTIDATADAYEWQLSTDNGSNFTTLTNNTIYSGADTKDLQINNVLQSYNNYQFRVILSRTGNACNFTSNAIKITVNGKPEILNPVVTILQCADDPSENTVVNLTEAEINISNNTTHSFKYFKTETDAINGVAEITDKEHYPVIAGYAEAWVRTISESDCHTISKIEINAAYVTDVDYDKTFESCDDFLDKNGNNNVDNSDIDGITNFNFSSARQDIINKFPTAIQSDIIVSFYKNADNRNAAVNPITNISNYRNNSDPAFAFNQTIFIKIKNKNNNNCEGIGKLFLKTNTIPVFEVEGEAPNDPIIICAKNIPYNLEVKKPVDDYNYVWRNENGTPIGGNSTSIQISNGGSYTVTAFSKDNTICENTKTIVVQKSDFDQLDETFVKIIDDFTSSSSGFSIEIDIPKTQTINQTFEYALEDENGNIIRSFQENNIFSNLKGGIYNVVVENKNGCGTAKLLVSLIEYPKFFTPNEDGVNDTWQIKGINDKFYKPTTLNIFDRYGKLLAEIPIDSNGWNGTSNGKTLPSGSYWYSVNLIPVDSSKPIISKKGNFSLLRK